MACESWLSNLWFFSRRIAIDIIKNRHTHTHRKDICCCCRAAMSLNAYEPLYNVQMYIQPVPRVFIYVQKSEQFLWISIASHSRHFIFYFFSVWFCAVLVEGATYHFIMSCMVLSIETFHIVVVVVVGDNLNKWLDDVRSFVFSTKIQYTNTFD